MNGPPPDVTRSILESIYGILLAFAGGAIVALYKLESSEYKTRWGIFADLGASGLAGVLTHALCMHLNSPFWLTAFLTGVAGYGGVETMHWFKRQVKKRLGAVQ